eukprot:1143090_1
MSKLLDHILRVLSWFSFRGCSSFDEFFVLSLCLDLSYKQRLWWHFCVWWCSAFLPSKSHMKCPIFCFCIHHFLCFNIPHIFFVSDDVISIVFLVSMFILSYSYVIKHR